VSTRDLLMLTGLLPVGLVILALAGAGVIDSDAGVLGWVCILVGGGVLVALVVRAMGRGSGS
jgi:hypothetical protein